VRVPDVEVALLGERVHRLAVRGDGLQHRSGDLLGLEVAVATGYDDAGGEALDIPLPRAWERLVEVADVEHQIALG